MTFRIVVVGTGTGVGKTHAAVALVTALAQAGASVCGLKPIESGVDGGPSDWAALAEAGTFHVTPPPYALRAPVSPHLAAEREGRAIRLARVVAWVATHRADVAVIETAGALLSPLSLRRTNLDLAVALEPQALLLVAPDRLGVLHDVHAALLALRARMPAARPVVLLQPPAAPDASTGTNATELRRLGLVRVVATLPRASATSAGCVDAARVLVTQLRPTTRITPARP